MSKKKRKERKPENTPTTQIGNALASEQDRGCVLVAAGYIEFSLEMLLTTKFGIEKIKPELYEALLSPDNRQAIFGDLFKKTAVARVLGLIDDDLMGAIDQIRKLRNKFAHTPGSVVLDEHAITGIMDAVMPLPHLALPDEFWRDIARGTKFSSTRLRFMGAAILVNQAIFAREKEIDQPDIVVITEHFQRSMSKPG